MRYILQYAMNKDINNIIYTLEWIKWFMTMFITVFFPVSITILITIFGFLYKNIKNSYKNLKTDFCKKTDELKKEIKDIKDILPNVLFNLKLHDECIKESEKNMITFMKLLDDFKKLCDERHKEED